MPKIYLVELESVPTRYTYYWKHHLLEMLEQHVGCEVVRIGADTSVEATEGAFLNFSATNAFKSAQAIEIASLFHSNEVEPESVFLFADAWNPVIIMVRYMIDLLGVDAKIASIWHAGSYDSYDLLGQKVDTDWSYNAERSFFYASDVNYFASEYHMQLISSQLEIPPSTMKERAVRTGFPMEYILDQCHSAREKDLIVFPHRLSEEKNYEMFKEVSRMLPEYKFFVCQEHKLSKAEYYDNVLSRAKIVFSANLQETLGIGVFEGLASGAIPLVPDRLSYVEMYSEGFRHQLNSAEGCARAIRNVMETNVPKHILELEFDTVYNSFFKGNVMYQSLYNLLQRKKFLWT